MTDDLFTYADTKAHDDEADNDYDAQFARFHAKHPQVYERLVAMARMTKARGREVYSIKTLWCVLRFNIDMEKDLEGFKLNDKFHSRYARLIMSSEADLRGFFELRELRT